MIGLIATIGPYCRSENHDSACSVPACAARKSVAKTGAKTERFVFICRLGRDILRLHTCTTASHSKGFLAARAAHVLRCEKHGSNSCGLVNALAEPAMQIWLRYHFFLGSSAKVP
jgi:hypothetical protein